MLVPDLEIALLGLDPLQPEPDTSVPADSISPATPLYFMWSPYPQGEQYWVDLLAGTSLTRVWRSPLIQTVAADFGGELENGSRIQAGTYWWAAGSRWEQDGYLLTVYGHLAGLKIMP